MPFEAQLQTEIIQQIEAKTRCKTKLPTWYNTANIYYPNKLNIEQTSSEITAKYKAHLVSGQSLIDLTGGFGVDTLYFSKQIKKVIHCEVNSDLSQIAKHNFETLNTKNIECINANGIATLKQLNQTFDWLYIDPSRRDITKQKVFLLDHCTPNIVAHQDLFFKHAKNVMIKTSPLLDLKATLNHLKYVKQIHIIAVNNDVKELLWILEANYTDTVNIKTINIKNETKQEFTLTLNQETKAQVTYSQPLTYLYEPNAAILKAGAFKTIANKLNINKLHQHSHLYTSKALIDFPGRCFKIEAVIPFNKKAMAKLKISQANVSTRNFPLTVSAIRKKFNLKDGGNSYLFFTTNLKNEKIVVVCKKCS